MASTPADRAAAPIAKAARVESLDILRGVAVFGILMMNITAMGLISQAYDNPTVSGGASGLNLLAYKIVNVGFEGTMRGIFSALFGAGIVLLTERMERAGAGVMAADIHFRRMLWMMVAGIIHWSLLLWYGEILFAYSLCGMLLFAFRKLAPRTTLILAGALLLGSAAMNYAHSQDVTEIEAAAAKAEAARAAGGQLTAEQTKAIAARDEEVVHIASSPEDTANQRNWHSGTYWNAVTGQFPGSYAFQWTGLPYWLIFDMVPFMLIGMALLKLGVLGAEKSSRTYLMMMVGGYAIGLVLGLRELGMVLSSNFTLPGFAAASETYQFSRLAMVIGHLGLLLLVIRSGWLNGLQKAMGAVGQMALTNYLMQTLITMALFYGFGFGLYEHFERYQLYGVVAAIWLAELIWSPLWLARFRFGPFEWLWRSLTYWQRQPMRI